MKLNDINIRDPYIILEDGKYYMYGTRGNECYCKTDGLDTYVSTDLTEWTMVKDVFKRPEDFWADKNFWAPEVHKYKDKFYMFVSLKNDTERRGTQILVSDGPLGPFVPHSDGPVTPREWECLDGTLYIDKENKPYMIFCHEWVQIFDGSFTAIELSDDLKECVGEPIDLFYASACKRASLINGKDGYVSDGPFMHRLSDGTLAMLWATYVDEKYGELVSYSSNGELGGEWSLADKLLYRDDGGHGMIFKTIDGELRLVLHTPNSRLKERPCIMKIVEKDGKLCVEE